MEKQLTRQDIQRITEDFLSRSQKPATNPVKQFGIFIGGFPGSGKTSVAKEFARLSGAIHIQTNSARFLLRETGFAWGDNVRKIIENVLNYLFGKDFSIVLDGGFIEESEKSKRIEIINKYHLEALSVAVTGSVETAETRARKRYADSKPSTFDDWRISPERFEAYIQSATERQKKLNEILAQDPTIQVINNDGDIDHLVEEAGRIWKEFSQKPNL